MTLDTYSHILPDMQDAAVKALDGLFREGNAVYLADSETSDEAETNHVA